MDNAQRDELLDRLMHQTLEEKLGAAKPCDVADKLSASAPVAATPLWSRTWFRMALAASVMVAVGIVAMKYESGESKGAKDDHRSATMLASAEKRGPYADDDMADRLDGRPPALIVASPAPAEYDETSIAGDHVGMDLDPLAEVDATISDATTAPSLIKADSLDSSGMGLRDYGSRGRGGQGGEGYATRPNSGKEMRWVPRQTSPRMRGVYFYTPDVEAHWEEVPSTERGRDRYAAFNENRLTSPLDSPISTFSIDVDTAFYSMLRASLRESQVPPPAAVRVEELVNYFAYDYPQPTDGAPFAVHVDVAACPWATKHRLVRIGLKGKEIAKADRPASNLVFLVDVSGSMQPANKLPLVRQGLLRLVSELDERDRVAIVVYAGSSGCVLASTPCTQANKERIRSAIAALQSGGSTNGAAGIELAYQIAQDHFVKGGANRVILCTDGDFNVGTTDDESLKRLVADRAKSGVFLTALGFGMGNHNDQMLETIADNGNGAYGYIDDEREVEKLFVRQLSGTLVTIAKDVKIQVEFNPALVGAYRLIGYENRILAKEDFNNDKKDAGDIGAGHTVTALYEIVPPNELAEASKANAAASEGATNPGGGGKESVDALEFQRPKQDLELTDAARTSGDLLLVKLRYKAPDGDTSTLIKTPAKDAGATFASANGDFKFAAAVAAFGMILRQSPFRGDITLAAVEEIAAASIGEDPDRQRKEFVDLVRQLRGMTSEGRGARD